jgi:hypothetical protein
MTALTARKGGLAASLALLAFLGAGATALAAQPAISIPGPLAPFLPKYTGAPATAHPLQGPFRPANPALAPDGRSGSGLASGNGAASPFPGPLGNGTKSNSAVELGTCTSMAFDKTNRLLALCNGVLGPTLRQLDPVSLATLATLTLPARLSVDRTDIAGGTHFIVRADGSLLVPTNAGTVIVVAVAPGSLTQTGAVDLNKGLRPGEHLFAVAAGYDGYDWVVGNQGTVLTLPRGKGYSKPLGLHEAVQEDIATDTTGTYVVTAGALYRLQAGTNGVPRVVWRRGLASAKRDPHSGRLHPGPGTPPAIVAGGFVAVADGQNPARLTVLRIAGRDSRRNVCSVPLFHPGKSSVEAQLVVAGRSIVATNAYGYDGLPTTELGGSTTGGITRVITSRSGCRVAWTSDEITPSSQPVVSRATGLLYTIVKPHSAPDAWNLEAIDWVSGKVRFAALGGEGLGYNSDNAAVVLGPDGAAYAGSFAGLTRYADKK